MTHYHGVPISGKKREAAPFFCGRHALVPFTSPDWLPVVAANAQSFILDNGAFTMWKRGKKVDFDAYVKWCEEWHKHPGYMWAIIPDVIDGSEEENDALLAEWPSIPGVPVWHMHESLTRLEWLCEDYDTVALGSSGEWPTPGTEGWWDRMADAMDAVCDDQGRPPCKLHGLRMMDPMIFTKLPFASADSTNAGMNAGSISRFGGYVPPTTAQRAAVIANRIEQHNSAAAWTRIDQKQLFAA